MITKNYNQKSLTFIRWSTAILLTTFCSFISTGQNVSVNPGAGSYPDLATAFAAINAGTHTGSITVSIVNNTTETASAVLNASGSGAASYTSIVISPAGARTISGAITGHLIDLNGADNVTIDGLNASGNSLIISNSATGASSTIRFVNDATNNTVTKCTLQGSTTSLGVVNFSTGTTTGNDGNNINNCSITAAGANLPLNGIYSLGTSAVIDNSSITINANNISDFFSAASASNGLNVNSFNSTWTISNNKLFQTATRTYTTANTHNGINVASGDGYIITGNTIGYATAGATGVYTMAGTIATRFIGIALAVGTTTTTSVQGNTITAINLATSSGASTTNGVICGINITSGNVNVGNVTLNTIGAASGTDAIVATPTTTGGLIVGINTSSTGTILIQGNTIGAFTSTGATAAVSGAVSGINISGSATSVSVINNTIGNATPDNMRGGTLGLTTGSTCSVTGINNTSTTMVAFSATGNTIQNFSSFSSGTTGCFVRGIVLGSGAGLVTTGSVSGNTITNLKTNSALTGYTSGATAVTGILLGSGNGMIVSGNTISNLSGLSALTTNIVVSGINLAGAQNTTVSENKIFGLSNAGTGTTATAAPVIAGVIIRSAGAGFPITIKNNMISLGNAQTTNTSIIGIMSNHGSTPDPSSDRIYFNTVNIEGVVTAGALPTACYNRGDLTATARTVPVDIKNNIFNNIRSGGTGLHLAIGNNINATASATGWAANASNYNVLNANAASIGYWTTVQTFAGWKTASASDNNSISGIPTTFVNTATGDLHLNLGLTPTQLESGGTVIAGFTTDFDNQTRPGPAGSVNGGGAAPDFGADEFDGVLLDIVPPTISFTPVPFVCTTGTNVTLTATITDASGVPTSGAGLPMVYWKVNAGAYTGTQGVFVSGSTYSFTFGNTTTLSGDIVSYYIVAQDNAGTPNVTSNPLTGAGGFTANPPAAATPPSTPNSYPVTGTISGSYNVGTGQTYTTLTAAVAAYNTSCLGGAVTFVLTDLTYGSETFPITINANAQASAINTLTIKPLAAGTSISGSSATSMIYLNGADFVTIDGSSGSTANTVCPASSASRDLTITNTNAVATAGVVWLGTTSGGNSVTNCIVKNCILSGASGTTIVGLGAGGPTIGTGGTNNDNISFINNDIRACQFAIYSAGASATNKNQNVTINQNFINTVSPNNIGQGGIYCAFTNNVTISGNTVGNVINTASSDVFGINAGFGAAGGFTATTTGIADGISNVTITNNTIGVISQSGTFSAIGIGLGNTISGTSLIANNMISGVAANGTGGDFCGGIVLGGGTAPINVYHNTVNMQGTIPGATAATQTSACLAVTTSTPPTLDLRNNIFSNTQIGNASATLRFASIALGYSTFATLTSNNNDLYSAGAGPGTYTIGITGTVVAGTNSVSLLNWQTTTGKDGASLNILPVYVSTSDLHLIPVSNSALNDLGTNVSIIEDIDCQTRSLTVPDMGADEFNPPVCVTAVGGTGAGSVSACGSSAATITASGFSTGSGSTYNWVSATNPGGPWTAIGGANNPASYTISPAVTVTTYFKMAVACSTNSSFDSSTVVTITVNPSVASISGAASKCANDPALTWTENGGTGTSWLWSTSETTQSISVSNAGTYTVTVTSPGPCTASASKILTVNPNPTLSGVTATPNPVCAGQNLQLNSTGNGAPVAVANYSFAASTGTYSPISGGTILASGAWDDSGPGIAIPLGFNFNYDGTSYSTCNINLNGYVSFGTTTSTTNYTPISLLTASEVGTIAAFGRDLQGVTGTGEVQYLSSGGVFTIQWSNARRYNSTTLNAESFNFQIKLYQTTNQIQFVYGTFSNAVSATTALLPQVGLRGTTTALFKNLEVLSTGNWATPNPGGSNTATAFYNETTAGVKPGSGLTYTFSPPSLTYSWSGPNTFTSLLQNPLIPSAGPAGGVYTVTVSNGFGCTASASTASVTVNPLPTPAISGNLVICSGGNTILDAGAFSSYNWSTGATTQTITVNSAGTFTVTVTNANSCTGVSPSVTTTINPVIIANCSGMNVSCNGGSDGSASVAASGGTGTLTYLWSNSNTNASLTGLSAGTYTVTVTDAIGCTATCAYTVTQPSAILANCSGTDVSCNGGSDGTASVAASGGTGTLTYLWSNSNTSVSITGLAAGTYTVTVTDANGCTSTCAYTVSQPAALVANCSGTDVSCNGGSNGTASVAASGGTGVLTYLWSNSNTSSSINGLTPGTYTVTATDANGCTATCAFTVTEPTAIVANCSGTNVTCNGGSNGSASVAAGGGTGTLTYLWSNSNTNASMTGLSAGTYTVTVTDANGCTATCAYVVTQPAGIVANCSGTNVSCNGGSDGSASVAASGGAGTLSYLWSNSNTNASITGLAAGTYTVTVTDANGCTSTCAYTVTQPSAIVANCSGTDISCNGGSNGSASVAASGGTGTLTYLWSNSGTSSSINGLGSGTYTVTVTDANGCTATCAYTVTEPTAVVANCSGTNVSCNGGSNGSASVAAGGGTGTLTYLWSNSNTNASMNGLSAGTYTVTVTDANGCTATCAYTVTQPSAVVTNCSGTNVSCNGGSDGTASVSASGGTGTLTYLWSNSNTNAAITGLTAGTYTVTVTDANGCTSTCAYTVTQPSAIVANCSGTDISCNGGSNGSASVAASGGTGTLTYLWSNSNTSSSINGLTPGTYTVTVTDASGCTATCAYTVTEPAALVVNCSGTNVSCNGGSNGSASVSASGGTGTLTYLWSNSNTNASMNGLSAGTYTVTITDANGCTATCAYMVTEPSAVVANCSGTNVSCNGGSNGSASVSASGGTGTLTYLWSNSGTNSSVTGLVAGTYTVTVTDANGCTATCAYTVTEPTAVVANCSGTNVTTNGGSDGTVSVAASGGTGTLTYLWSNGNTNSAVSGLTAGTYTVTVTDANGCTATCSKTLTQPSGQVFVNCGGTNVTCFGGNNGSASVTATGGTSPYTYLWSNGNTNSAISILPAGTYTVTVTDAALTTASCQYTVTQPAAVSASGVATNISCRGNNTGSIIMSPTGGTPPYTYLWNNGSTVQNRLGLAPGTYMVTVKDVNLCQGTASFTITQPATVLVINTSKVNVRCNGASTGSITASAAGGTGPYSYSWNTFPVQTTATIATLPAGVYTCTVTDAAGCIKSTVITITEPPALVVFQTQSNVTFPGGNNGSASVSVTGGTPGYTYNWNTIPVKTTATVTGLTAGTYKCSIYDSRNCVVKVTFIITEPQAKPGEGDAENKTLNISPNPSGGQFIVSFLKTEQGSYQYSIEDLSGKFILKHSGYAEAGKTDISIDLTLLPKGVYFLRWVDDSMSTVKRIVLQ